MTFIQASLSSKSRADTATVRAADSTSRAQNVNTITIQIPRELSNQSQPLPSDGCWTGARELLIAYAWPLVIVFVTLLFYKHLSTILKHLADYVKNLDEVSIGNLKFKAKQGEASFPTPAPAANATLSQEAAPQPANLSKTINKILSTLWKYQKAFKEDFSKRWTFMIGALNPEYPEFIMAIRELASKGLVAQDPKTGQFLLTDIGIFYCRQYEANLTEEPYEFK